MDIELLEIVDALRSHAPMNEVPESELQQLARHIEVRYERRGTQIMHIGKENNHVYFISAGAADVFNKAGELVGRAEEGGYFGYYSLLLRSTINHDVKAIEDTLLYRIPAEQFHELRKRHIAVDRFFNHAHKDRLRAATNSARERASGVSLMTARLSDLANRAPITATADMSIREAAVLMSEAGVASLLIEAHGKLIGIVTDRDLRRRVLAKGLDPESPLSTIMTAGPITAQKDSYAFEAILTMTRHNIHHLPVVDKDHVPTGMMTVSDLLRFESNNSVFLVGDVYKQRDVTGLARISKKLPDMFCSLVQADASAQNIGEVVTSVGEALTKHLLTLAEEKLGPPPVPYCWLSLGSQARDEQTAHSDQDNALILSDDFQPEHDEYFKALAKFVSDGLDECGYVYCPGDVMATNDKWRQPLSQWKKQFDQWVRSPDPKALMHASIFFDLRPMAGQLSLGHELHAGILEQTPDNRIFLAYMARNGLSHRPPLGFFRQFVLDSGGDHKDALDLKHRGVVPVIDLARVYALSLGCSEVNTLARLQAIGDAKAITSENVRDVIDAYEFICETRMRHQAELLQAGEKANNYVRPDELSAFDRRHLKEAFQVVNTLQASMEKRFHASSLG